MAGREILVRVSPSTHHHSHAHCRSRRRRNRWGQSGHGLTTLLTCYYKAKLKVQRVMSLSHPLLAYAITRVIMIGTPWSVYCRASSEMSDAVVAVCPNCSSAQHSKVTYSLHKHLAWPLQCCFLRICVGFTGRSAFMEVYRFIPLYLVWERLPKLCSFVHTHSEFSDRAYSILCHVYSSNRPVNNAISVAIETTLHA